MSEDTERTKIVENLEVLNKQVARQNSFGRMLVAGIIYGIGFFIGSAILATIAFGIVGPLFGSIPWIRNAFEIGYSLTH